MDYDPDSEEDMVKTLMQSQHKAVAKDLKLGTFDDKIDSYLGSNPELLPRKGGENKSGEDKAGEDNERAATEVEATPPTHADEVVRVEADEDPTPKDETVRVEADEDATPKDGETVRVEADEAVDEDPTPRDIAPPDVAPPDVAPSVFTLMCENFFS